MRTLLVLILFLHACSYEPLDTNQLNAPIVNGQIEYGYPEVGELHCYTQVGGIVYQGNCTATLISDRIVLTAAHCVTRDSTPNQYCDSFEYNIGSSTYNIASAVHHPNYIYDPTNYIIENDVAIVTLSRAVNGITPAPIAKPGETPTVGELVKIVGFGITADGRDDNGIKRSASAYIVDVDSDLIVFDGEDATKPMICSGDSGGPTFANRNGVQTVIGVHSFVDVDTNNIACRNRGYDARVDVFYSWISSFLPNQSLSGYGESCLTSENCESGLCAPAGVNQTSVCTIYCSSNACPNNDGCRTVTGYPNALCTPNQNDLSAFGESCTSNSSCESNICIINKSTQKLFCSTTCSAGCPSPYECDTSTGYCNMPATNPLKQIGELCSTDAECYSNLCASHNGTLLCTTDCTASRSCASPLSCQDITSKNRWGCIPESINPGHLLFGAICSSNEECQSGICHPTESFCTNDCQTQSCIYNTVCQTIQTQQLCSKGISNTSKLIGGCQYSPSSAPSLLVLLGLFLIIRKMEKLAEKRRHL